MGLGSDCSSIFQSAFNPSCWYTANVNAWFGVDNSASATSKACSQASGGNASLYQSCMSAQASIEAAQAKDNPASARDYQSVIDGDLLDLVNPFTGTGPLADINGNVPTWVWYAGAGLLGFIALSGLRR